MAKNLATILKTDVMSGVPLQALAEIVRRAGRGRDTVLAHITPREAAKLKKDGGSGTINPETGLPEFEDYGFGAELTSMEPFDVAAFTENYTPMPDYTFQQPSGGIDAQAFDNFVANAPALSSVEQPGMEFGPGPAPRPSDEEAAALAAAQTGDKSALDKLLGGLTTPKGILGALGAGAGLYGSLQAQRQAANVAAQMRAIADQQKQMAQPYMQQGGQLLGTALQGGLAPVQQQAFDAARARIAQAAEKSGGVGAAQAAFRTEDLRQRLVQNQIDAAMKLLGPGNQLIGRALQQEIQALITRAKLQNQAAASAGNFFTALARLYAS